MEFRANLLSFHQHSRFARGLPFRSEVLFCNCLVFQGLVLSRDHRRSLDYLLSCFIFINILGLERGFSQTCSAPPAINPNGRTGSRVMLIRLFQQAPICCGRPWRGGLEGSARFASPYRSWTCALSQAPARFGTPRSVACADYGERRIHQDRPGASDGPRNSSKVFGNAGRGMPIYY